MYHAHHRALLTWRKQKKNYFSFISAETLLRERMKHGEKNAAIVKNHPFCMSFVKSTHSYGIINERDSFSTIARTPLACQKNKYNFRMKNNHLSCFAFCPPFRSSFQFFGIAVFLTVMGYTRSSRNDSRSVKRRVMLLFVDAPRDPEKNGLTMLAQCSTLPIKLSSRFWQTVNLN